MGLTLEHPIPARHPTVLAASQYVVYFPSNSTYLLSKNIAPCAGSELRAFNGLNKIQV